MALGCLDCDGIDAPAGYTFAYTLMLGSDLGTWHLGSSMNGAPNGLRAG